jgi:hypothetical protein
MTSALSKRGSTRRWRKIRAAVLARDRHTCQCCGAPATEVDHIIGRREWALSDRKGWVDSPGNLAASCLPCNRAKGGGFFSDGDRPGHSLCPLSPHGANPPETTGNDKNRLQSGLGLADLGPLGRPVAR